MKVKQIHSPRHLFTACMSGVSIYYNYTASDMHSTCLLSVNNASYSQIVIMCVCIDYSVLRQV